MTKAATRMDVATSAVEGKRDILQLLKEKNGEMEKLGGALTKRLQEQEEELISEKHSAR